MRADIRDVAAAPFVPGYFRGVAIDFDGTLAADDRADPAALEALGDLRRAGLRVVLVTGRILTELRAVFPDVDDWTDAVVAENGAVAAADGVTRSLAAPVPAELTLALSERGIRFRRGDVLLACEAPDEAALWAEVRRLELECQLVRNRGSLMVLPAGVTKGTGLIEALADLGLSHHNVIAVGDAENDHSLLDAGELGVAVANAVESLKARADVVVANAGGAALAEFLRGPVVSGRQRVSRRRWRVELGALPDGQAVSLSASQTNLLVTGTTHGGKSHLTGLIAERLIGLGYSVLVMDPEGDHTGLGRLRGVLVVGGSGHLPSPDELVQLVRHRFGSVVVDLSTVSEEEKAAYLLAAPAEVEAARERTGLPHWVILDEAHELLGGEGVGRYFLEPDGAGVCLVTHRPEALVPEALLRVDVILAMGADAGAPVTDLIAAGGGLSHDAAAALLQSASQGQAVLVDRRRPGGGLVFTVADRTTPHVRHWHKYAVGRLPAERRFYFRRSWDDAVGTTAANLEELEHRLRSCGDEVIEHHCDHGDFSRWIGDVLGDDRLAGDVAGIEAALSRGILTPTDARRHLLDAIHRRNP